MLHARSALRVTRRASAPHRTQGCGKRGNMYVSLPKSSNTANTLVRLQGWKVANETLGGGGCHCPCMPPTRARWNCFVCAGADGVLLLLSGRRRKKKHSRGREQRCCLHDYFSRGTPAGAFASRPGQGRATIPGTPLFCVWWGECVKNQRCRVAGTPDMEQSGQMRTVASTLSGQRRKQANLFFFALSLSSRRDQPRVGSM